MSNTYISNLLNICNIQASIIINSLKKKGYVKIEIVYKQNSKEIAIRKIIPINKYVNTSKRMSNEPINKNVRDIINNNKIYNKILTDEEFMEIKQHGSSDYPFQYYYDNLELFDFHCIEWHWHREFEFLYVESGEVTCGIGEKQIILSEGEAIFINSKILHRFYASSGGIIPNFVCMPEFIAPENSLIYKKYILPIISSNIYFQRFQPDELWQTKIIQTMIKIMEIQRNEKIRELATLALLQDLWLTFYENVKLSDKGDVQTVDEVAQKRVQLLMQYIHENYNRNLSLDEIASHIGISKSTALNLFHRFLHTTPVNYLIGYRLQAASWLLKNTNKKVKTIAYESGFHNVDYFCRLFKKRYHLTPSEYRCTCLKVLSADPSLQTCK